MFLFLFFLIIALMVCRENSDTDKPFTVMKTYSSLLNEAEYPRTAAAFPRQISLDFALPKDPVIYCQRRPLGVFVVISCCLEACPQSRLETLLSTGRRAYGV